MTLEVSDDALHRQLRDEVFGQDDDADNVPSDTPPNHVPREGSNPAPEPDDGSREFVRQLFNPA